MDCQSPPGGPSATSPWRFLLSFVFQSGPLSQSCFFLFGRFEYLGEFCFCFLATRRSGCSWVAGMHLDNRTLTLAILNLSCTVANNLLKKLAYKAEKHLSNRKHKDKQHVTQVLIEWKSGSDLVSLFTNGIKHIPCQKGYGSPPSHRIRGMPELEVKAMVPDHFQLLWSCGRVTVHPIV